LVNAPAKPLIIWAVRVAKNEVKKFFILEHDLTQETGELTPTLKVKRNIVNEKYMDRFDALYGG
jgi:long-subunit acyl-CoA synthetase (AMP-forming)